MSYFKRCVVLLLAPILIFTSVSLISCRKKDNDLPADITSSSSAPSDVPSDVPSNLSPNKMISVYETTGTRSSLLQQSFVAAYDFISADSSRETIYVNTEDRYQSYIGYGASLTHASAYLLMQADAQTRSEILYDLFSRDGANLSVVRIPVGASDYIPGTAYFTCDDMPAGQTDVELKYFNLDNDSNIIAVAKEIIQINPDVTFLASPWSAPAWMKTNDALVGAAGLKSDMYEVYANYLVKFITEYQKEGIDITMITLVNEPGVGNLSYPTMNMSGAEAAIITAYAGAKLEALGLDVDIVGWDYNYGSSYASRADAYFEALYKDAAETAGKYSDTVGFHVYDGDAYWNSSRNFGMKNGIEKVSREYGKASIITEITESSVSHDFAGNLTWASQNVVISPCAAQNDGNGNAWNGCGGALYWNLVLDSNGQPCPASHSACYGVIALDATTKDGVTTYHYGKTSAYYAMAQVSKFLYAVDGVECYALNATTTSKDLTLLAFRRGDGATVVVACNTSDKKTIAVDLVIDGQKISYELKPQSIVTFVDAPNTQSSENAYTLSNVVMTQKSIHTYQIAFSVECGSDDVQVYFTDRDRLTSTAVACNPERSASGKTVRFSFEAELAYGEEYYLWVVGTEKQSMLPLYAPYMLPYLSQSSGGVATLYFQFSNNLPWSLFCDSRGKAVYESTSAVFDESAKSIAEGIDITSVGYSIPAYRFSTDKYYYVVLTAKNGLVKIVSQPLLLANNLKDQVSAIAAEITEDRFLQVKVTLKEDSDMANAQAEYLQLLVKHGSGTEIYGSDCVFEDGVATLRFDCQSLLKKGVWYDLCLAWHGSVFMDIPKTFAEQSVNTMTEIKKDGITYGFADWKPDTADESGRQLKVYFDIGTNWVEEICKDCKVTFSINPVPTLLVTAKLKDGMATVPQLAITGGNSDKLVTADGVQNSDGSYTYTLKIDKALAAANKWYDIRFFIGNAHFELRKSTCISSNDFSKEYVYADGNKTYTFKTYNAMLKITYTMLIQE